MAQNGSEGVYHRLKALRFELGISQYPDSPVATAVEGLLDALIDEFGMRAVAVEQPQMYRRCTASLIIKGAYYRCDLELPYGEDGHEPLAHCSREAEAIWDKSNAQVH